MVVTKMGAKWNFIKILWYAVGCAVLICFMVLGYFEGMHWMYYAFGFGGIVLYLCWGVGAIKHFLGITPVKRSTKQPVPKELAEIMERDIETVLCIANVTEIIQEVKVDKEFDFRKTKRIASLMVHGSDYVVLYPKD